MNVLAVGAHPDDIELGCAGTLASWKQRDADFGVLVVTNGEAQRDTDWKLRAQEAERAGENLGASFVRFLGFEERNVCFSDHKLVGRIRAELESTRPDVVYCHSAKDHHQTHVAVAQSTLTACLLAGVREVYAFEVPSTTAQFAPTAFMDITMYLGAKLRALDCFESQADRYYMLEEAIVGLARHRAYQARIPGEPGTLCAAEAFEVERMVSR